MTSNSESDLQYCRDEALLADPWFRLHFSFAPGAHSGKILALHALFAGLQRPLTMSDESLSLAQLAWWHQELSPQGWKGSAHPVVRALRDTGVLPLLGTGAIDSLLAQIPRIIERITPASVEELRTLCDGFGMSRVGAEIRAVNEGRQVQELGISGAGSGLTTLVELAQRSGGDFWFLPLDIRARHRIDRAIFDQHAPRRREALESLRKLGEDWHGEQYSRLETAARSGMISLPENRHLFAWLTSQRLQLQASLRHIVRHGRPPLRPWSVGDPLRIWRACRRLSGLLKEV